MRRILSTTALLGLLATTASGFGAPQFSTTTTKSRQRQQFPRSTLFPIKHSSSSSSTTTTVTRTCPTTVNRMTSDPEEAIDAKDSTSEETSEVAAGATAINGATNGATNGDAPPSTVSSTNSTSVNKDSSSSSSGFSMILLPTLLFKFTIVMCVKFATDIVVFPLLWLYRLARMCKRKVLRGIGNLFGGKKKEDDINGSKINGDGGL
eukprot:CAMPEP_0196138090 /NCGR_PEP_ID=MMETSP0910-20130528/5857_1 /TAXON_ID=49265 /ORGANISM="Thalassiosira rotula, Strain GSO102" /LENGTH=206 /DNA_ID=CAMNT_0041398649 /DNA_START=100 /DNA_END=720 /DNA_ORIENTATION=+